jgi:benzoyl-CoA reductase/2-hydroxyglutaryl-CoA dehydratase subunit BcrC/BadD/HgdB
LESLESIYDPQIEIYEVNKEFWGKIIINHPDNKEDKSVEFLIGDIKTNSDPETLKSLSKEKARDEVKKLYPLYF